MISFIFKIFCPEPCAVCPCIPHPAISSQYRVSNEFLKSAIENRQSSIVILFGIQPIILNPSCSAIETNGYIFPLNNNWHLTLSMRMFQHDVKLTGIRMYVKIINFFAFFGKCFTSSPGIRSSILSEDQNLFRHFSVLLDLNNLQRWKFRLNFKWFQLINERP